MNISSPCIHICQFDENEVCLGCYRTKSEIVRWMQLTENERLQIMSILADRKPGEPREVMVNE